MNPFVFTPDLLTGLDDVDDQHRQIFAWGHEFFFGTTFGSGDEDVRNGVRFLARYVEVHFAGEQRAMEQAGYPDRDAHVAEHAAIGLRLRQILDASHQQGLTEGLKLELHFLLSSWFTHHIAVRDREMVAFLRASQVQHLPSWEDLVEGAPELPDWMQAALKGGGPPR